MHSIMIFLHNFWGNLTVVALQLMTFLCVLDHYAIKNVIKDTYHRVASAMIVLANLRSIFR